MKVYIVSIKSANRTDEYLLDEVYYVSTETGEIIESTH